MTHRTFSVALVLPAMEGKTWVAILEKVSVQTIRVERIRSNKQEDIGDTNTLCVHVTLADWSCQV